MKRQTGLWVRVVLTILLALWLGACTGGSDPGVDDLPDGDAPDGDAPDGDDPDGDDPDGDDPDGDDPDGDDSDIPRLRAEGLEIVDEEGNPVILKGLNLGGYLYNETWITLIDYPIHTRAYVLAQELDMLDTVRSVLLSVGPWRVAGMLELEDERGSKIGRERWLSLFEDELREQAGEEEAERFMEALEPYLDDVYDDSDLPIKRRVEELYGVEARDELFDTYIGAWIQEKDIRWIAEQGFNLVRVPIGYRTLTTGSHLEQPTELVWNESSFAHIENLLDWCENWGVYAIIDIQECPGGQNDYSGEALLYGSELYQRLTVELWEELSRRYKHRNIVAAYSLLAEPMNAPSKDARDEIYDKLVKAIRAQDDDHLLVIHDGFMSMSSLPKPSKYGWENVIYSTHIFEWGVKDLRSHQNVIGLYDLFYRKVQEEQGVPYFIGSFSTIWDEPWAYEAATFSLDWYATYGWSWSMWTYKRIDDPIGLELWDDRSAWGLKNRLKGPFDRPDLFKDDRETLEAKFASYADLELEVNQAMLDVLQADLYRDSE